MPSKPQVEVGIIDYPVNQVVTNLTGEEIKSTKELKYEEISKKINGSGSVRKPLKDYDRAVCFLPDYWEMVQNYIDLLEEAAKQKSSCQTSK